MTSYFRPRTFAVLVLVLILAAAVYAFAAANTVSDSYAGDGLGTISGYNITGVHYTLNGTNPANISTVAFTISPASATQIYVSFDNGTSWDSCTNTGGSVSCSLSGVTAAGATSLRVVSTD